MKHLYLLFAACSFLALFNGNMTFAQDIEDIKSFPKPQKIPLVGLDTTIIVYNTEGKPLRYYQYLPLVMNKKLRVVNEQGKRYLRPWNSIFPKSFLVDSLVLKNVYGLSPDDSVTKNNVLYWALQKADHLRVEKSKRKMYVERNGKILFGFPIDLGKHPVGHKQKEGDGRTPEGSYFIDYNINSNAAYNLGLHISYPNAQDSLTAKKMGIKPGGDVMIHGTSAKRSKLKDWTNGCIAISNENLGIISKYYYNGIPIQINK